MHNRHENGVDSIHLRKGTELRYLSQLLSNGDQEYTCHCFFEGYRF